MKKAIALIAFLVVGFLASERLWNAAKVVLVPKEAVLATTRLIEPFIVSTGFPLIVSLCSLLIGYAVIIRGRSHWRMRLLAVLLALAFASLGVGWTFFTGMRRALMAAEYFGTIYIVTPTSCGILQSALAGLLAGVAALLFVELREKTKAAQPGATDNPDDAQRLREDH